jgi:hypothetical protein
MSLASPVPFRCSTASRGLDEPMEGTASTVRAFVLLETPGPWGVDAVPGSRLPVRVKHRLTELKTAHAIRPLLIRRTGRRAHGVPLRLFAAFVRTDSPWMETASLSDVQEVLDLDFGGLAAGRSPGLERDDSPMFLVCTHGRHDACCAERGRPLAQAFQRAAPRLTWEVSHVGGDRFAPNLLVLPHGLYYGRLDPSRVDNFVTEHLAGRLDLEHLRGRSEYAFSVQAAEIYLRRHLGLLHVAPMPMVEHTRHGTETTAVFDADGKPWRVRVHTELGERRQLTCRAAAGSLGPAHQLLGIEPVTG